MRPLLRKTEPQDTDSDPDVYGQPQEPSQESLPPQSRAGYPLLLFRIILCGELTQRRVLNGRCPCPWRKLRMFP